MSRSCPAGLSTHAFAKRSNSVFCCIIAYTSKSLSFNSSSLGRSAIAFFSNDSASGYCCLDIATRYPTEIGSAKPFPCKAGWAALLLFVLTSSTILDIATAAVSFLSTDCTTGSLRSLKLLTLDAFLALVLALERGVIFSVSFLSRR
ncbi:hypothetical protein A0O36_01520 [Piscirickettsiaceae bacterium NZ-RLO1]|nr:hypothetical protein A0O36_01520 [Piscirickettsiaceae bacterium NZ-RLO1]